MIGLLGGTFDPVHYGHLRPAQQVCQSLALESVRFIPAANPPHRSPPVAGFEQRVQMLRLALPMDDRFELDDREQRLGGVSYTVKTLDSLREELGDSSLGLIIGADQFADFENWHQWQRILDLTHLLVINRPGTELGALPQWAQERLIDDADELRGTSGGGIYFVEVTPVDISATAIRRALAREESVAGLLPEAVLNYIETNRLYVSKRN